MVLPDGVERDVVYPVTVGGSFDTGESEHYVVRYDFKPASVDREQPGHMQLSKNEVHAEFANKETDKPNLFFSGNFEPAKEKDTECLLIFDEEAKTFRVERINGNFKSLKLQRNMTKFPEIRSATPPVTTAATTAPAASQQARRATPSPTMNSTASAEERKPVALKKQVLKKRALDSVSSNGSPAAKSEAQHAPKPLGISSIPSVAKKAKVASQAPAASQSTSSKASSGVTVVRALPSLSQQRAGQQDVNPLLNRPIPLDGRSTKSAEPDADSHSSSAGTGSSSGSSSSSSSSSGSEIL